MRKEHVKYACTCMFHSKPENLIDNSQSTLQEQVCVSISFNISGDSLKIMEQCMHVTYKSLAN